MKILIVNTHYLDNIGGSEIQCHIIANRLTEFGHRVVYGAVRGSDRDYQADYKVRPIGQNFYSSFKNILKEENPDVIYWRSNKNRFLWSAIFAKSKGIKIVFSISHIRDIIWWNWSWPKKLGDSLIKYLYRCYRAVLFTFTSFFNQMGFWLSDGAITNNGDFLDQIPHKKKIAIHNSWQIEVENKFSWPRPFVVWVSNVKSRKNPEKFIELGKRLPDSGVDFLMVGRISGPGYDFVAEKKNWPKGFYYLGAKTIDEVNDIIDKAQFLVHTCDIEGFPNVMIQAWTLAKPVVSLYYNPENLLDDKVGIFSGNFDQLVRDTDKLIKDNDLREKMSQGARQMAKENFSPEVNVKKLEEFLKSIVK